MKFGTGRGRKAHMVSDKHTMLRSACGRRLDAVLDRRFIDRDEFCGNCRRTVEYRNADNGVPE